MEFKINEKYGPQTIDEDYGNAKLTKMFNKTQQH